MVSIITVCYKVKEELIACISSIFKSKPKVKFEIIVVDNEKESGIGAALKSIFPKVKYIRSSKNIGFGAGNNLGAKAAAGEYLFFLNPDTKILPETLDNLHIFLIRNDNVGIVSPVFLDNDLKPLKSQGSKELTPKNILFSQSLLRKIFPKKNIYNTDMSSNWNMKNPIITETVPGAAMMMSANLFRKIGGFDEKVFLYFEENDISKRISNLGYKLFIIPSAKIIHLIGRSTSNLKNIEAIYSNSRYFYVKKHYGLLKAILTQAVLSINRTFIFLLLILAAAIFLRLFNLENTMPFIGDSGWFYLSARDMIVDKVVPLVGIPSSHPWINQGPLWTYMLASVFWLFGFNPLNGAYLTIILGVLSVLLMYIVGSEMFSKRAGLISALLYATSPLVVIHSRTPYHTSPIPLFTLLFIWSLYKFVNGNKIFFPLAIFFLAILYNFELATSVLWFVLFAVLAYGIWKKKMWAKKLFNKKILIYSVVAFLAPMLPILIYDFSHNFPQTLKFAAWIGYRILRFFGYPSIHGEIDFLFRYYQNLIFSANNIIAFIILILSFGTLFIIAFNLLKNKMREVGFTPHHNAPFVRITKCSRNKVVGAGFTLLTLWILISLAGYFVNKTSSEAYLPIFFPALIFLIAFSFDKIMKVKTFLIPIILSVIFIAFANSYSIIRSEYSVKGLDFSKRLAIAKEIIKKTKGEKYNIVGRGNGSEFESFTMNYEYLTWWLGHPPAKSPQKLKFVIQEDKNRVILITDEF